MLRELLLDYKLHKDVLDLAPRCICEPDAYRTLSRHNSSKEMAEGRYTLLPAFCLDHTDEETTVH